MTIGCVKLLIREILLLIVLMMMMIMRMMMIKRIRSLSHLLLGSFFYIDISITCDPEDTPTPSASAKPMLEHLLIILHGLQRP